MREAQSAVIALRDAPFHKSSYSSPSQNCVAVGRADPFVGLQDMKEGHDSRRRTTVVTSAGSFAAFITAIKDDRIRM